MIRYTGFDDNCLQCCVAGLLNLPLQQVPHIREFMDEGDPSEGEERWVTPFTRWCRAELGLVPVLTSEEIPYVRHIRAIVSSKGNGHATIAQRGYTLWDPAWMKPQPKVKETREFLYSIGFITIREEDREE